MNSIGELDVLVAAAVAEAAAVLRPRVGEAGERALREALVEALRSGPNVVADAERAVPIAEFQGVGPVDVVLRRGPGAYPFGLIECKWSGDPARDKIYEAAWDAVKLALATRVGGRSGWLVTGAPVDSWKTTETGDLFSCGTVDTRELWSRPLRKPGMNGGLTVGEDCRLGGRGNMFTHAHPELIVEAASTCSMRGGWEIRISRVRGRGGLIWFADAPEFPQSINQAWLDANVPDMDAGKFDRLLVRLRAKRWTTQDIETRVMPLRIGTSDR